MSEDLIENTSNFYSEIFTFELQKMILPVLMVLLLSASAFSTLNLRNSPQSEERTDLSLETMTNLSAMYLKTEYFNESINKSGRELSREISRQAQKREKQLISGNLKTKTRLGYIQQLGLFPFAPELYAPVPTSRKDMISTVVLIHYRQSQFEELDEKLNSSENMTLEEFNAEVQKIRDSEWKDEKVQAFLKNYTFNQAVGTGLGIPSEEIREKMKAGNIQELTFTSYLPAILATFLLYYVINAAAVETGRKAYTKIKKERRESEKEIGEDKEKVSENRENSGSNEK